MTPVLILALMAIDVLLVALFVLLFSTLRRERSQRAELTGRVQKLSRMLEEMVQLNEAAFRNMTDTIRTLEGTIQTEEPVAAPSFMEKKHRILGLLRKGFGVEEITRRLNVPRGEVELMANLGSWLPSDGQMVQ